MIIAFQKLSANEMELVYKAPILVCILIAGADGTIDKKEMQKAVELAEKKITGANKLVASVFHEIAQDFEDKVKILFQQYPYDTAQRNPMIVEELSALNEVFRKTDSTFASEFYNALVTLAHQVARSSGGILGYKAVGDEEARYINLDMIKNPFSN